MSKHNDSMAVLLQVVNDIKKTGLTVEMADPGFFLGGDLGIDSREMLEIFYEVEQRLDIRVDDSEKRDLYTLADVVALIDSKVGCAAPAEAA